jgi:hypothetical protein
MYVQHTAVDTKTDTRQTQQWRDGLFAAAAPPAAKLTVACACSCANPSHLLLCLQRRLLTRTQARASCCCFAVCYSSTAHLHVGIHILL